MASKLQRNARYGLERIDPCSIHAKASQVFFMRENWLGFQPQRTYPQLRPLIKVRQLGRLRLPGKVHKSIDKPLSGQRRDCVPNLAMEHWAYGSTRRIQSLQFLLYGDQLLSLLPLRVHVLDVHATHMAAPVCAWVPAEVVVNTANTRVVVSTRYHGHPLARYRSPAYVTSIILICNFRVCLVHQFLLVYSSQHRVGGTPPKLGKGIVVIHEEVHLF
mmetsp:Transcript_13121/g.18901  ORF Transcript_13121/g.18901 Transcript_13121/m.18901 type:complete len:217 (-) Transcript_13121:1805-2455(-)